MSCKTLDQHVRDHYADAVPRTEVLARLRIEAELRGAPTRRRRRFARVAAIAAIAVAGAWWLVDRASAPTGRLVAGEIALNHGKALPVDFALHDPEGLAARMDRLDFRPVWTPRLASLGAIPVGARYCSLAGQIAAQIVLEGPGGERWTLYQTRDGGAVSRVAEGRYETDGVEVELWRDGDVLIGLASALR